MNCNAGIFQEIVRTKLDKQFDFGDMLLTPKQIVTRELDNVVKPTQQKRKGLF